MVNISNERISFYSKINTISLVLVPIVNQYKVFPLTFLQIYALVGVIFGLIYTRTLTFRTKLLMYIVYTVIVSSVGLFWIKNYDTARFFFRIIGFVIVTTYFYVFAPRFINLSYLKSIYSKAVIFITIAFFVQFILYKIFNLPTMLIIPNTILNYNDDINSNAFIISTLGRINTGYYYRPSSFFIEPVYQCMYSLPWLSLKLFSDDINTEKNLVFPLIVSVAMILTTSTMGMLGSIILWAIFIVRLGVNGSKKMRKAIFLTSPILIIATIGLIKQPDILISVSIKVKELRNLDEASSLTWRLLRGFESYKKMGIFQQIFGCGYGNITDYFKAINLITKYDANLEVISYMSGIYTMLCSIGLLGVCIYFSYFFSFIFQKKICFETKMLFICWVMMMGSAAVFDTDRYFLCTVLILCTSMNSRENISPNYKVAKCSNDKLQMDNTQREVLYL